MESIDYVMDAAQFVIEPPTLWAKRVPARYKQAAPQVVALPEGGDAWSYDSGAWMRPLGLEVAAGHGPLDLKTSGFAYSTLGGTAISRGLFDPKERLKDMRRDGVDAAAIFPTYGLSIRNIMDRELHLACVRAYNDGIWEWCREGGAGRLIPQAMIPCTGLEDVMAELRRIAKAGFKGIVFDGWPAGGTEPKGVVTPQGALSRNQVLRPPEDPFWELCQEAGIVINLVRGGPTGADRTPSAPTRWIGPGAKNVRAADIPPEVGWVQESASNSGNLGYLVLGGILERFPRLQVAMIDCGAGWLALYGELLDWNYRYARFMVNAFSKLTYMPSDYLKRQVKATVRDEPSTIAARADVGVGALMWYSGYPTSSSTWPSSARAREALLRGIPADEQRRILGENCAALYGVALPSATAPA